MKSMEERVERDLAKGELFSKPRGLRCRWCHHPGYENVRELYPADGQMLRCRLQLIKAPVSYLNMIFLVAPGALQREVVCKRTLRRPTNLECPDLFVGGKIRREEIRNSLTEDISQIYTPHQRPRNPPSDALILGQMQSLPASCKRRWASKKMSGGDEICTRMDCRILTCILMHGATLVWG